MPDPETLGLERSYRGRQIPKSSFRGGKQPLRL